jgi:hypothetical protein
MKRWDNAPMSEVPAIETQQLTKCVPEEQVRKCTICVPKQVEKEVQVKVCKMVEKKVSVPACQNGNGCSRHLCRRSCGC